MKKILLCLLLVLLLSGCSNNSMNLVYTNDKEIANDSNSYNLTDDKQNIDGQVYTGEFEFEGMDTLWTYETDQDCKIDISYLLSLSRGKAKLVLITPDGAVTNIVENTNNSKKDKLTTISLSLLKGENRIKLIAANKAQIELEVQIDQGDFEKLGW